MPFKNIEDKRRYQNQWKKDKNKKERDRLINILGSHCVRCFSTHWLEFHHKIPILRHLNHRYHITNLQIALNDFKKDAGALCLLCDSCHHDTVTHQYYQKYK